MKALHSQSSSLTTAVDDKLIQHSLADRRVVVGEHIAPPRNFETALTIRLWLLRNCRGSRHLAPRRLVLATSFPLPQPMRFSTPTKAKVEGTTPVRNLFSSPYIGNNLASETAQGSLDAPIPPLDEVEVYDSLDGAEGQSGAYPNSDHAVDTASSQVFEDGVGQPDEWAFWPPAPSSDNAPAPVDQTSEFEETSRSEGLRLDESFFRHNTVRIFDPLNLPPSNMSVLLGFASRYPAGVHTMAFLNMFRQCLRCDRIVLADKRREHKCPVPGQPLPSNLDVLDRLLNDGKEALAKMTCCQ
ncbi:hypothetical protein BKA70DRAFT_1442935 [Coprinopsis sp. MPI-PUGE-AT-0042]|nr:hypothetical protein BKA70DRAFT_1442935 [Coprinopsis sp. MPI-PUGE-AT-0042]